MNLTAKPEPLQQPSKGFSLIEMLVASTVGLILILGMITVFLGNKRSSDLNTAMANLQENARFAMDKIANDIRMSGFQGCVDINRAPATILATSKPTDNYHASAAVASVISEGNSWFPSPPLGFNPANHAALTGTHALTLQFAHPSTFPLAQVVGVGGIADRTAPVVVDITPGVSSRPFDLEQHDYAFISNCSFADVFRISSLTRTASRAVLSHKAPDNISGALSTEYGGQDSLRVTNVMRFVSNVYYVGNTGNKNSQGDEITALYQQSLPYGDTANNPPTELIQGIEDMRISFGLRTGTDRLIYVDPDDSRFDATQVETLRIGLLMNSYDRILDSPDTNTYVLAGNVIESKESATQSSTRTHAGDLRFRLAFNTTVKVRNRRATATTN